MESVRLLRADQVGSLLRPPALLEARAAQQARRMSETELSELEDEAILTALKAQTAARQQIYVDGEFRRTGFNMITPGNVAYDLRQFPHDAKARFVQSVMRGKNGRMPPWGDLLSPGDVDELWAYVKAGGKQ